MSSISVSELKTILNQYPDDYEVIMEWCWKEKGEPKSSIAYINGARANEDFKELYLMN